MASAISLAVEKSASRRSSETGDRRLKSKARLRSTRPPEGILPMVGWFICLVVPWRRRRKSSHRHRPLGGGIHLAVSAIERSQQQQSAFDALGVADRRDRHVDGGAGAGEGREVRGDKDGGDIFYVCAVVGGICAPMRWRMLARVWVVKTVCWLSPVSVSPDHHAIANQGILAYAFDGREVADLDGQRLVGARRNRKNRRAIERR